MEFLHVRHATSLMTYAGIRFLVDPVLANQGAYPPLPQTPQQRNNPLVGLSTPLETLLSADVILSTHTHSDHFDSKAAELLDKDKPLICQASDEETFRSYGFKQLLPLSETLTYNGVKIVKVYAQHGFGVTEQEMGLTSGYILSAPNEPTVYFTGDTVYNDSVRDNILNYKPDVLVMNAGSPKFLNGDHIVMNILDLEATLKVKPALKFVVVHLETYNHCIETRADIREYFTEAYLKSLGVSHFHVPADNEVLNF